MVMLMPFIVILGIIIFEIIGMCVKGYKFGYKF